MRSERTVIRCIRRLVEAGVAAYRDSSTGRRFVYRNETGEVVAGFGIDFTPARVRAEELMQAVAQYQQRLAIELAAKRDIARLSRSIEDMCVAYPDETKNARSELATIRTSSADIVSRAREANALHERVISSLPSQHVSFNLACKGDIDVTPIINTTLE